jgi:hypothetical protein
MSILIKRSSVPAKVPATTDLNLGELAINTYDGKLYLKKNVSGTDTVVDVTPVTSVAGRTGAVTLAVGDVSGAAPLASPTFTGTVTLPSGSYAPGITGSTNPTVTAAGTTQATATSLTADVNIVTTATVNQGVVVSGTPQGKYAVIVNRTAVTILVYPASGHAFDGLATNTPISLPSFGFLELYGSTTTQWHTTYQAITQGAFVAGNISGNAANVTGTVAVANGGTGVTTSTGTGSNVLSNSPTFTGSQTAPTPATSDNSTTLATTAYVKTFASSIGAGTRTTTLNIATAGQTVFTVPGGYAATLIDVRMNGFSLASNDYIATNGTSITLLTPANLNDEIETVVFASQNFASGSTLTTQAIVATDQQTTFTIAGGYVVGLITVYQNGLRLPSNEYTATNGTTVVLALPVPAGTEMFFEIFSAVAFTSSVAKTGDTMSGPLVVNSTFSSQSTGDGTSSIGFRNRIINGDMRIDQRNVGAAVTPTTNPTYLVDRFQEIFSQASKLTFQQVVDAPAGFKFSTKISVANQYSPLATDTFLFAQRIEGLNIIDLNLGTTNAVQLTLSSYIKGSVAGTYAVSLCNSTGTRSYIGIMNVTSSWSRIVITIPGETTGTWNSDNTFGMEMRFDLGSGSNFATTSGTWQNGNFFRTSGAIQFVNQVAGSTLNITGVQLEAGSVASPFDQVDYGRQLIQCQRYYEIFGSGALDFIGNNFQASQNNSYVVPMKVTKRTTPTFTSSWTLTNASTPTVISVDATYIALNTINTGAGQWRITSSGVSSISAEL